MSKQQISLNNKYDRIVVLIDMDCFYCQVEEKLNPALKGKPIAVVQYNAWRGGGIIAVNYPARDQGVTRHMRGDQAKEACPDIELVRVPNIREKADLSKYREAGKEVAEVLQSFTALLERASVDEAYLDITEQVQKRLMEMNEGTFHLQPETLLNTYALGFNTIGEFVQAISAKISQKLTDDQDMSCAHVPAEDRKAYRKSDIKLLIGASIVNEIRAAVKARTGYECSAGIAHNKILAKLVCGMNKPNKQTLLPLRFIDEMYRQLPIRKVKGLGGKFGEELCEHLKVEKMFDLQKFTKEELQKRFDERQGQWLYWIARGIDLEAVTPRFAPKSIACCKKFPGRNAISGLATLNHWLRELGKEISERLEKDQIEYNRRPKQLVVSYIQAINGVDVSSSRSVPILNPIGMDDERLAVEALEVLKKNTDKFVKTENCNMLNNPIKFLGMSVGKFEATDGKKGNTIQDMFRKNIEAQAAYASAAAKKDKSDDIEEHDNDDDANDADDDGGGNGDGSAMQEESTTLDGAAHESKTIDDVYHDSNLSVTANQSNEIITRESVSPAPPADDNIDVSAHSDAIYDASTDIEDIHENNDDVETCQDNMIDTANHLDNIEADGTESVASASVDVDQPQHPGGETSTNPPDYMQTYAEFQRPAQLPFDIPTTVCDQCNKAVKITELQTHTDAHLAFRLSQAQREEFRSQMKTNAKPILLPSPVAKRLKTNAKASATATTVTSSLDRFLVKKESSAIAVSMADGEPQPSTSTQTTIETETCSECHKAIPVTQIVEHMDYHVAKRLQAELQRVEMDAINTSRGDISNTNSSSNNNNTRNTINHNNVHKKQSGDAKNKKKSGATNSKSSKIPSVASFFTK